MKTISQYAIDPSDDLQIEENEPYEVQRARAWEHKQQLDRLPTFSLKLEYWLENIDSFPHGTVFQDGENVLFTLELHPETDDDKRELYRVWMDYHRKSYAQENRVVNKFCWRYSEADKEKVAYYVQPLEALQSDLESRLSTATRKHDLLQTELTKVTATIDAVGKTVNGIPSTLAREIKELRYSLETNRPYNFAFVNEYFPGHKAALLAEVWDIVQYEKYLKDKLSELQTTSAPSPPAASDSNATSTIYILPDARSALIDTLLPFIDPSQHDSLNKLIDQELAPSQPIICQCNQVRLGQIFYEMVKAQNKEDRKIQSDKTNLAKWICQCFERNDCGVIKKLTESTMLNYLKGKGFPKYR